MGINLKTAKVYIVPEHVLSKTYLPNHLIIDGDKAWFMEDFKEYQNILDGQYWSIYERAAEGVVKYLPEIMQDDPIDLETFALLQGWSNA